MTFESLSQTYEFEVQGYPERWLPLTYLYDPDLPLFPTHYYHVLDPRLPRGHRPGERDRAYGFVQRIEITQGGAKVVITCNRNLRVAADRLLAEAVEREVSERLGIADPVELSDLDNCFSGELAAANDVLRELWYQAADGTFARRLPFGALWDPVFGLARFIASWNSDGGRKGELIQTHYFCQVFGNRISTGGGIHADFYLLPTYQELRDRSNPLALFPQFAQLLTACAHFTAAFCEPIDIGAMRLSAFRMRKAKLTGILKKDTLLSAVGSLPAKYTHGLTELYNAFNRGPQRSVLGIMMLADLREHGWSPETIDRDSAALLYTDMGGSYQSPKVMHLYAQLCFGNRSALPIDNWVTAFLKWPLGFGELKPAGRYAQLFQSCEVWGKVERLIWMAAQARKVHSSVCESILWCVRYGDAKGKLRGAGPLSCKVCEPHFRQSCAAYQAIEGLTVSFNGRKKAQAAFNLTTSSENKRRTGQNFAVCEGLAPATRAQRDEYTTKDRPAAFGTFPAPGHDGSPLTVADFIEKY